MWEASRHLPALVNYSWLVRELLVSIWYHTKEDYPSSKYIWLAKRAVLLALRRGDRFSLPMQAVPFSDSPTAKVNQNLERALQRREQWKGSLALWNASGSSNEQWKAHWCSCYSLETYFNIQGIEWLRCIRQGFGILYNKIWNIEFLSSKIWWLCEKLEWGWEDH